MNKLSSTFIEPSSHAWYSHSPNDEFPSRATLSPTHLLYAFAMSASVSEVVA